ncbi:MAG: hypothetical protein HY901_25015 [Deltaproteobacteria bacterium]|nr:hypothetical protein [Deltaproteobacteria bacterium]
MDDQSRRVRALNEQWLREAALRAASRAKNLLAPVASFGVLHFARWDLAESSQRPAPDGFIARELAVAELAAAARAFGRSTGSFHRRARLGDRCFGAFQGDRLVNLRWAATRPIEVPELDLFVCPGPTEAYFYAAMTLPEARGQGAAAATRRALESALLREGFVTGHAYVAFDNIPSVRTRHSFHEDYTVAYLRLRGGKVHLYGSFRPPVYREADIPAIHTRPAATGLGGTHRPWASSD